MLAITWLLTCMEDANQHAFTSGRSMHGRGMPAGSRRLPQRLRNKSYRPEHVGRMRLVNRSVTVTGSNGKV